MDPEKAAQIIANLLPGGATNYSVGVLSNGDILISKVSGVTAKTQAIINLAIEIKKQELAKGRSIYLAQQFNTSVGSNHAEMCLIAAAKVLGSTLKTIYCTGPHCGFCSAVMKTNGIALGNSKGNENQMGWTHPFVPLNYGQQLSSSTADQLKELQALPAIPLQKSIVYGKWGLGQPQGKCTKWF